MRQPFSRYMTIFIFVAIFSLGFYGNISSNEGKVAFIATIDGIINPVTERYVNKVIGDAENEKAELVIILLNTPGGLLSSTRHIVETLLSAKVPVVIYVSPPGAQAASAGTFITAASHIAVMAPGTNIGAATPVGSSGEDLPSTLGDKATNDAAAFLRAIAAERGRNIEKLEATVQGATSYSSSEAVAGNVVDFTAQDLKSLLTKLDGREVKLAGTTISLQTRLIRTQEIHMSFFEKFLYILADPNISFLLLSIGGAGVVIELLNPGLLFPGVAGVILLLLAFVSLGNLPVNWAGAALILFAGALITAEIYMAGFGIFGIGGIISFVLGSILLFAHLGTPSPTAPSMQVSLWLLIPFSVTVTAGGWWLTTTIVSSRKDNPVNERSPLLGLAGTVTVELGPQGQVQVRTEHWSAVSENSQTIGVGEKIRVARQDGAILTVQSEEDYISRPDNHF
ncbi:nodulation protein NfeD [SAR202 cluster bacterium AD-804-J14_MRT_500m]|nr:nodulation protein NfeD [SAR202 cluster bacterium AD-804-J14_MRT_500m]